MQPVLAAQSLAEFFQLHLFGGSNTPGFGALALAAFVHVLLLGMFFGIPGGLFIWGERKIAGRIQDRLGPTRVGGKFGWLQSVADGLKLVQKEDIIPQAADPLLFRIAPYIVLAGSFAAYMLLPFSNDWVAVAADVGLFLIFAVLALEVVGVILGGYASGSKWALYGAMREAAQMISYEIPMSLCMVVPVLAAGTLNLVEIGRIQSGWFTNWLVFHDPFTFLAFFVYFACATASCKRAPFDLAEAESELVAGFMTEYSGMRWALFFLAEYASMFLVSGVAVVVFLGGWNLGIPFAEASWPMRFIGMCIFLVKSSLLVILQIWVRWTLPRLRIDQVVVVCWKYLFPISCVLLLGAALWPLLLVGLLHQPTLFGPALGEQSVQSASVTEHGLGRKGFSKSVISVSETSACDSFGTLFAINASQIVRLATITATDQNGFEQSTGNFSAKSQTSPKSGEMNNVSGKTLKNSNHSVALKRDFTPN